MREEATAFVPGHVTGFFSAHPDEDPTKAGSRGGGLTLTDGVEVTVEPATETTVILDGEPIEIDPVRTVLEALEVPARVEAESDLPLGAGFGVSGAMALGTAFAANQVFERRRSRNELVAVAHAAEVEAGTGLGDVVAQAQGGIPIRLEPGGPAVNELDAVPARSRIEYVAFGELSTADVLAGETAKLSRAGEAALSRLVEEPTLECFMNVSRRFAREAELLTPTLESTIEEVTESGGQASMAMLGETVFALGTGLSDVGYEPSVCRTHPSGAVLK
ncbi:pantoate kinase [Natronococcus sp. A-GB1]|uniref:pantoate kinase n=1 Tax=Natronococcus sp. A-GB1 TaxID=3037648 RepID=UPI00241D12B5|nr:pantoate kinase [Natronococcus sp. A-GB1]MDG5758958.1 pantoate kinase [Natronococcus sp. A-GB1]